MTEWSELPSGLLVRPGHESGGAYALSPSGLVVPERFERRLTCVDLFCGAGGFSLGVLQAGFEVVAACDNDVDAAITYLVNLGACPLKLCFVEPEDRHRFEHRAERMMRRKKGGGVLRPITSGSNRHADWGPPGWQGVPVFWLGDVSKLSGAQLLEPTGIAPGELDLVVGGPPCQGYSFANANRGEHDSRNGLVFEFARLVCEMRPHTFYMENVPGMIDAKLPDGGYVVDELMRTLQRGDFAEIEALRRLMTPGRVAVKRGAGKGRRTEVNGAKGKSDSDLERRRKRRKARGA